MPDPASHSVVRDAVEVIAHRGYSARAPENTLAALEAAVAAGADAVEFDLHAAGDGVPVLFHDAELNRTTDAVGPLRLRTFEQLRRLDAGTWFSPDFAGERIPSLREALDLVRQRVGHVYAEVKGVREDGHVHRMVHDVSEAGMLGATTFIAMDWTVLERVRALRPELPVGYIVEAPERTGQALERVRGDAHGLLDFKAEILLDDPSCAERAVADGIELAVWTVDDPRTAGRLLELGVRRFTTNQVETLLAWKKTL